MVEIAKALSLNARIVIMDEPTSALTETEATALFRIIRGSQTGRARRDLHRATASRKSLCHLRPGDGAQGRPQRRATLEIAEATADQIVQMMVGRPVDDLYAESAAGIAGAVVLSARGLRRRGAASDASAVVLEDIDLDLRAGEILGVAGLVGSGRTELARAIFGADPIDGGEIALDGVPVRIGGPKDAIQLESRSRRRIARSRRWCCRSACARTSACEPVAHFAVRFVRRGRSAAGGTLHRRAAHPHAESDPASREPERRQTSKRWCCPNGLRASRAC